MSVGDPSTWSVLPSSFRYWKILISLLALIVYSDLINISTCFVVKKRLELKSKFEGHIQAIVEYASTIDDFDELVDP